MDINMKHLKIFESFFTTKKTKHLEYWTKIAIKIAKENPKMIDISESKNSKSITITYYPLSDSKRIRYIININADIINNNYYSSIRIEKYINDKFYHEKYDIGFFKASKLIDRIKKLSSKS